MELKGEEKTFDFNLYPPEGTIRRIHRSDAACDGQYYGESLELIEYDHIPTQTVLQKKQSKIVKIDLKKAGQNIAYIEGAGDAIPESLEQIGYDVTMLNDGDITLENLKKDLMQ